MKYFFPLFLILLSFHASADLAGCLGDAKNYFSLSHHIVPDATCIGLIKSNTSRVEASSADGTVRAVGYKHMVYVEVYAAGVFQGRELLAGDQTELDDVKFMKIDQANKRLLVLQQGEDGTEFLSFNLETIGNVSPAALLRSDKAEGATSVSMTSATEVALTFSSEGKIRFFSSKGDSRYATHAPEFNPVVLREQSIP